MMAEPGDGRNELCMYVCMCFFGWTEADALENALSGKARRLAKLFFKDAGEEVETVENALSGISGSRRRQCTLKRSPKRPLNTFQKVYSVCTKSLPIIILKIMNDSFKICLTISRYTVA